MTMPTVATAAALQSDQSDLLGSIFSDHPCADLERVPGVRQGGNGYVGGATFDGGMPRLENTLCLCNACRFMSGRNAE